MSDRIDNMVLWVDETLLAVNKPPGLLSLPDGYNPNAPHLRSVFEPAYGRLWTVHRLDRETSGVVLLARTPDAHRHLNVQFQERQVVKIYHALVVGGPNWEAQSVDLRLRAGGDRRHRTVVDREQGKPAVTRLRVLERFGRYALVEAIPETGRTHQVRVHLKAAGAPLVCDPLYGDGASVYLSTIDARIERGSESDRPLLERLGLHAWSLEVSHPKSGDPVSLKASYPEDLVYTIRILRSYAD